MRSKVQERRYPIDREEQAVRYMKKKQRTPGVQGAWIIYDLSGDEPLVVQWVESPGGRT